MNFKPASVKRASLTLWMLEILLPTVPADCRPYSTSSSPKLSFLECPLRQAS